MTREEQFSKARQNGRRSAGRTRTVRSPGGNRSSRRTGTSAQTAAKKKRKSRSLDLAAAAETPKRGQLRIADPEFYRPLKKPVTLRLDADVLAWFRKDGRRYQTRINQALREMMEREAKKTG
jgi:uncharacterized protein (DUF4415 family)